MLIKRINNYFSIVEYLSRYCSFLQQDKYSSTNPYFRFDKREDNMVQAECFLPMNFPLVDKKVKVCVHGVTNTLEIPQNFWIQGNDELSSRIYCFFLFFFKAIKFFFISSFIFQEILF